MAILPARLKRLLALLGAAGLIISAPGAALAFGFGNLSVDSHRGEPLLATILLDLDNQRERETLDIYLASPEEYAEFGIEYPETDDLSLEVAGSGPDTHLRVTSAARFDQPYLNLLLRAVWEGGLAVRQYTLLLPASEVEGDAAQAEAAPAQVPVRSGDTLLKIVQRLQLPPLSVSSAQGLVALLNANPEAFIDGNMNWLLSGTVLRIPSVEEIAAVNAEQATRTVQIQHDAWREQLDLAAAAATDDEGTRLVLSAAEFSDLQQRVDTLESRLYAANNSNEQLTGRVAQLQQELKQAKEELARAEQFAASQDEPPAPAAPDSAAEAPAADASDASDAGETDQPAPADESAAAPQAEAPADAPSEATSAEQAAAPAPDPPLFSQIRSVAARGLQVLAQINRYRIEILGGVLLLVAYLVLRRRWRTQSSEDESFYDASKSDSLFLGSDDDFATEAEDLNVGRADALAEAETHMSRGDSDSARRILELAWYTQPERYELAVKLLEIHQKQGSTEEFETLLDRLNEVMPEADPHWLDVDRVLQEQEPGRANTPPEAAVAASSVSETEPERAAATPAAVVAASSVSETQADPARQPASPGPAAEVPAKPAAPDEPFAARLLELENHVRERNFSAFENLANALLADITPPDNAGIAARVGALRAKLAQPETPPAAPKNPAPDWSAEMRRQPAEVWPAAGPKDAEPAPAPAKPPSEPGDAPSIVEAARAQPAKPEPAPAPAPAKPEPAQAQPAAAPAAEPAPEPDPAKPKPAGPASNIDIPSVAGSGANALAMAKIYMEMEEMDIAKQFLLHASEQGSPDQREEATRLLKWWET